MNLSTAVERFPTVGELLDPTFAPTTGHGPSDRLAGHRAKSGADKRTLMDRVEEFITRLSMRSNFWYRVCSWIWLPLAYRSGIRICHDGEDFAATLPYRRFNRNWYSAMAGAALLGNSEIAGGMFIFKKCRGICRVVCKELHYRFLRPCVGPAQYRMSVRENLEELLATEDEFNVTIDIDIVQHVASPQARERRVGRCAAEFHATPIRLHKEQLERRKQRGRARKAKVN